MPDTPSVYSTKCGTRSQRGWQAARPGHEGCLRPQVHSNAIRHGLADMRTCPRLCAATPNCPQTAQESGSAPAAFMPARCASLGTVLSHLSHAQAYISHTPRHTSHICRHTKEAHFEPFRAAPTGATHCRCTHMQITVRCQQSRAPAPAGVQKLRPSCHAPHGAHGAKVAIAMQRAVAVLARSSRGAAWRDRAKHVPPQRPRRFWLSTESTMLFGTSAQPHAQRRWRMHGPVTPKRQTLT